MDEKGNNTDTGKENRKRRKPYVKPSPKASRRTTAVGSAPEAEVSSKAALGMNTRTRRQKAIEESGQEDELSKWETWKEPQRQTPQRQRKTPAAEAISNPPKPQFPMFPSPSELVIMQRLMPSQLPSATLEGFCRYLKTCKHVIVCIGAGASVACGIPDFRTPGKGLYSNQILKEYNVPKPEDVFNLQYFRRRPDACYAMLKDMWPGRWPPSRTHYFMRLLEVKGVLQRVYTQNIDNLESLANISKSKVVEAHGSFNFVRCVDCGFSPGIDYVKKCLAEDKRPLCSECTKTSPNETRANKVKLPGSEPKLEVEQTHKEEIQTLFVYGTLRPDDTSHLDPLQLGIDTEYRAATLKGVRLYVDKKPIIRVPDPTAESTSEVHGFLVRFPVRHSYLNKIAEIDILEGCPVLCKRIKVWAHPKDGGPPIAAEVYHNPHCSRHTVVPHGDWERRGDWKSLPVVKGLIKPGIVFFDEQLPTEFSPTLIKEDTSVADAIIIIGTSLRVTPFCWLPHLVKPSCPRLLLNINATEVGTSAGFSLGSPSTRDLAHDGCCQKAVTRVAQHLGYVFIVFVTNECLFFFFFKSHKKKTDGKKNLST